MALVLIRRVLIDVSVPQDGRELIVIQVSSPTFCITNCDTSKISDILNHGQYTSSFSVNLYHQLCWVKLFRHESRTEIHVHVISP